MRTVLFACALALAVPTQASDIKFVVNAEWGYVDMTQPDWPSYNFGPKLLPMTLYEESGRYGLRGVPFAGNLCDACLDAVTNGDTMTFMLDDTWPFTANVSLRFNRDVSDGVGNAIILGGGLDIRSYGFPGNKWVYGPVMATVPEPATWALMIGGFALIGAAMRRRRSVSVTFA